MEQHALRVPQVFNMTQATNYRFGPYELRSRARELHKHGVRVKLRAQPFQVLNALLERAGDVLTREELRKLLWPQETFVDFEHGLNAAISELRAVLNDAASDPRYIETLPKVGYRISVPVEAIAVAYATSLERPVTRNRMADHARLPGEMRSANDSRTVMATGIRGSSLSIFPNKWMVAMAVVGFALTIGASL